MSEVHGFLVPVGEINSFLETPVWFVSRGSRKETGSCHPGILVCLVDGGCCLKRTPLIVLTNPQSVGASLVDSVPFFARSNCDWVVIM